MSPLVTVRRGINRINGIRTQEAPGQSTSFLSIFRVPSYLLRYKCDPTPSKPLAVSVLPLSTFQAQVAHVPVFFIEVFVVKLHLMRIRWTI